MPEPPPLPTLGGAATQRVLRQRGVVVAVTCNVATRKRTIRLTR